MNESFIKFSHTFVKSKVDPGLELYKALALRALYYIYQSRRRGHGCFSCTIYLYCICSVYCSANMWSVVLPERLYIHMAWWLRDVLTFLTTDSTPSVTCIACIKQCLKLNMEHIHIHDINIIAMRFRYLDILLISFCCALETRNSKIIVKPIISLCLYYI